MCGRFYIADEDETGEIQRMIDEAARRQQAITGRADVARGEVAPGMTAAALALSKTGRTGVFPMEWGFELGKKRIINVRLETAAEKLLFRDAFLQRRCLLPMTHYFEWEEKAGEEGTLVPGLKIAVGPKRRTRYAIRPAREGQMYLAGLYRYEPGKKLPVFAVLTCAPHESIGWLHDRMPVILAGQEAERFLYRKEALENREQAMLFQVG